MLMAPMLSATVRMSDAAYERLTPEDLGLPPEARMPVRFGPAQHWSPLVLSFPHVGLAWPHDLSAKPQVDFPRNADYGVHTLYDLASHWGAASVTAVYSRLVADLNRADDDISRRIVPDHPAPRPRLNPGLLATGDEPGADRDAGRPGRGVVWATAIGNVRLLSGPLPYAQFRQRMDRFHAPYYRALEILLERRRKRFGYAILLDGHSMPGSVAPDLVLGTLDGRSCDSAIQRAALEALGGDGDDGPTGIQLALNRPYLGGELVRRFGRPHEGLHALQLEVSRELYMDEQRYRLYAFQTENVGTEPSTPRGIYGEPARASTSLQHANTHRKPIAPNSRQARRLAELRSRVRSLVRCLAGGNLLATQRPSPPTPASAPSVG